VILQDLSTTKTMVDKYCRNPVGQNMLAYAIFGNTTLENFKCCCRIMLTDSLLTM